MSHHNTFCNRYLVPALAEVERLSRVPKLDFIRCQLMILCSLIREVCFYNMVKTTSGIKKLVERCFTSVSPCTTYLNLSIQYPYHISIWVFKVEFQRSKYDEYHYSTHYLLFVSEFDPRIQSEKEKLFVFVFAVSVRIRSIFITSSSSLV
jgi:hypothetical protein